MDMNRSQSNKGRKDSQASENRDHAADTGKESELLLPGLLVTLAKHSLPSKYLIPHKV